MDSNNLVEYGSNSLLHSSVNSPYSYCNWDQIYLGFREEMTMFHNIVHLVKQTSEDELPVIEGVAPKHYLPLFKEIERIYDTIKRLEKPADNTSQLAKSTEKVNDSVETYAQSIDIDLLGFTTLEAEWVFPYSSHWTYPQTPQPIRNTNVISIGMQMDYSVLHMNHSPDPETLGAVLRVYASLGEAVEKITMYVRSLGYEARGHHPYAGDFLYSAHAVKAGIGELGANGLVLTQKYGPRQRFAAITTNAPVSKSNLPSLGVDRLCSFCMRCVDTCPTHALSSEKVYCNGTFKWKLNNEKCWPYFVKNNGCGLCLIVCPWNRKETWHHFLASKGVGISGLFARILLAFDNIFFWKRAITNPRNRCMKRADSPLSFERLLEIFGREKKYP